MDLANFLQSARLHDVICYDRVGGSGIPNSKEGVPVLILRRVVRGVCRGYSNFIYKDVGESVVYSGEALRVWWPCGHLGEGNSGVVRLAVGFLARGAALDQESAHVLALGRLGHGLYLGIVGTDNLLVFDN